jgi:hypothetical protein
LFTFLFPVMEETLNVVNAVFFFHDYIFLGYCTFKQHRTKIERERTTANGENGSVEDSDKSGSVEIPSNASISKFRQAVYAQSQLEQNIYPTTIGARMIQIHPGCNF